MRIKQLAVMSIMTVSVVFMSIISLPRTASAVVQPQCDGSGSFLSFPTWYKYLDVGDPAGPITDKTCDIVGPNETFEGKEQRDTQKIFGLVSLAIIEILLRIGGLVSVAFVVYGGFRYITSQGEPENTKSARQTIMNAIIGVIITTIATGIVAFIGNRFS